MSDSSNTADADAKTRVRRAITGWDEGQADNAPRRAFSTLLSGLFVAALIGFVPGLQRPADLPREGFILIAAPVLLALALRTPGFAPSRWFGGIVLLPIFAGLLGVALAPEPERMIVARDFAAMAAPWMLAWVASGLCLSADYQWTKLVSPILAMVGLIGLIQAWFGFDWVEQARPPASLFVNRNVAAQVVILLVPLAWADAAQPRPGTWRAATGYIAGFLAAAFLICTRTRGAWIAALLGWGGAVVVLLIAQRARRVREREVSGPPGHGAVLARAAPFWCVVAAGAVTGALVPLSSDIPWPTIGESLRALPHGGSTEIRKALYLNTSALVSERPVLGWGSGRFPVMYPTVHARLRPTPGFGLERRAERVENDFLEYAIELGLPAAGALAALLMGGLVWSYRRVTRTDGDDALVDMAARAASVGAVVVHSLVSFPLHFPSTALLVWWFVGTCWSAPVREGTRSTAARRRVWRCGLVVAVFVLATLATGFAVWVTIREWRSSSAILNAMRAEQSGDCQLALELGRQGVSLAGWQRRAGVIAATIEFSCEQDAARSLVGLEAALDANPNDIFLLLSTGARRLKAGRSTAAESVFARATELDPALGRAWLGLAMARDARGNRSGAAHACQQAVHYAPLFTEGVEFCRGRGLLQ